MTPQAERLMSPHVLLASGYPSSLANRLLQRIGQVAVATLAPKRSYDHHPTAIPFFSSVQPPPSTSRYTKISISIWCVLSRQSRALSAFRLLWWSIRCFPPNQFQSSFPTPRLIPANSIWRRLATEPDHTSPVSSSR